MPSTARTLCLSAALLLLGCGYHVTAGGAPLPQGIRHVFVPVFTNHTPEPRVEVTFTEALREQAIRAGTAGDSRSEGRVEGEVRAVTSFTGVTYNNVQNAPPVYRLSASVRLRLLKGNALVAQTDVDGTEDYLSAAGDILATEANRQAALQRLAASLMRDGYERLASGF